MGLSSRFSAQVFRGASGVLPYRLLTPPPRQTGRMPLVLFLHGAGERGTDNEAQLHNGAAELLGEQAVRIRFPCYFVLPQCPPEARWVEVDWGAPSHSLPVHPSAPLSLVLELLRQQKAELSVDPFRVYLIGISMGGYGVWDLLGRCPEEFAAAVPICGGGDETQAERMAKVPIWAFHGARDEVVPPARSRHMIEALRRAGGTPRYTEFPKVGHAAWVSAFAEPQLLPWLFAQRRGL